MLDPFRHKQTVDTEKNSHFGRTLDHRVHAMIAKLTGGQSPIAPILLLTNWLLTLGVSPGKILELADLAQKNALTFNASLLSELLPRTKEDDPSSEQGSDRRFSDAAWNNPPFSFYKQAFLANETWWQQATQNLYGLSPKDQKSLSFLVKQIVEAYSPTNFLLTNPEALNETQAKGGQNLLKGYYNMAEDVSSALIHEPRANSKYRVGETLGVSPGKVVFRNHLIELIQYEPTTKAVHPEPLLIVPAWIMKYYILDLRPENSLVRYLVSKGFTVFMISWRNPGQEDAHYDLEDYLEQGPMAALNAIEAITGATQIHGAGYCLGGTLLSIAAANMARLGDKRLKSLTLLAAQTDFSEAGEITLFVSESNVAFLEDLMEEHGVLEGEQMASAFKLLRASALIWQRLQHDYFLGERSSANDMMAWNADTTRMPYKMHSEYLRKLYLNNELSNEKFDVSGHPIALRDIKTPIFAIGTETDHVAPWKSVFKIHGHAHVPITFVLTKGGHNAGIISEPGHPRRHFRVHTTSQKDLYLSPDEWMTEARLEEGSWWPEWSGWLARKSSKKQEPPKMGKALCDAPGTYVMTE